MVKKIAVEADDDLLNGLAEIAAFIRRNKRQAHYLFAKGRFGDGVKKVGPRTVIGSKSKIGRALKGDR